MSSSKEFKDFILDQLKDLYNVRSKPMMGEFLLYYDDVLFGGIYDNRLLIKMTDSNKKYHLSQEIPYPSAKPMYMVENLDDTQHLTKLIQETCNDLKK